MHSEALLEEIVHDPASAGVNERQATKLHERLSAIHLSRSEALQRAAHVGRERAEKANPTIYLANVGSSGSHWAQSMLSALAPMLPCGEVYFPTPVLDRLSELPHQERAAFMQTYYAIHGWRDIPELRTAPAVNTAHRPKPGMMASHDRCACLILLIRDPVEIVISRTFRKQKYRAAIGYAKSSDADYMQFNIKFVHNFFRRVDRDSFDTEIRYEDLKSNPASTLRCLADVVGLDVLDEKIAAVAESHTAERLAKDGRAGNLYTGCAVSPPTELIEKARADLSEIRAKFGYA
ncbi:sulfotransferase [Chelativorans salis]|uniref:Sulfotransferase n=1 Tax=Chelativorans salis TaxID=2978478 RepID=A0ABT2LYC9_9HYPH|nr:sulfotransferase [Chelativorans sp. EGI FJ00035]MCT7378214.1 sulfotransferase [Chelativorans sp. EGI FJ00035]